MNDLKMAADLRAAAGYLRQAGWLQGHAGGHEGPACMVGAILEVTGWTDDPRDYLLALGFRAASSLEIMTTQSALDLKGTGPCWNDQPGRTFEEVLDRLESTALALEVRALAAEAPIQTERFANVDIAVGV